MERERSLDDELPDDEYGNHYREPLRPTDLDEDEDKTEPFDEEGDDLPV